MATDERSMNNVENSMLSDTEEMEESEAERGDESDSQEVYFRPRGGQQRIQDRILMDFDSDESYTFACDTPLRVEMDLSSIVDIRTKQVRRIQDTEDILSDGGDLTEAVMSGSSTEEEAETERNDRDYERYSGHNRMILLSEDESEGAAGPDSDIYVFSNVREVAQEFHSDRNSENSDGESSDPTWNGSELSEEEDTREDNEDTTNQEGSEGANSDVVVIDEIAPERTGASCTPPAAPSTSKENESSTASSSMLHEDDDNVQTCPICFEIWNNVGDHRIVSLKCGHLFGKKCIERWLQKPGSAKCPQCNAKAFKRDIRVIYAKSVKVEDSSERERLMQEVEKLKRENAKHEREKVQQKMKITQDFKYISDLQKQLRLLQESASKSSQSTSSEGPYGFGKAFKLGLYQSIDLNIKNGSCRVMAFNEWMNMLVISVPSHVGMFPGFGMKKISTIDFKVENFYHLHSKQIRDFAFNPLKEDLLLSVGFDKIAKVTNVSSNSTLVSYNTESLLWSCCWSRDNTSDFFVGTASGSIYHFDTVANTEKPVKTYNIKGTGPVVSVSYVPSNPNSAFMHKGLLVTRLNSISFEEFVNSDVGCISHDLFIEGTFTHTAFDPGSMHFLTTCRPNDRNLHVRHKLYALKSLFDSLDCQTSVLAREIHNFQGSTTMKVIERTCLTTQNNGQTLLAIFNEESTNSVKVCDVSTAMPIQTIKTGVNIIDLIPIKGRDGNFIAMLSEKCIKIYKWIPQF